MELLEDEGGSGNEEDLKKMLDDLIKMNIKVSGSHKFSKNEEFKEIKSEDIKFLLIPFYQSEILQRFYENRETRLEQALLFYDEFFKTLKIYDYLDKEKANFYKILRKKNDEELNETDQDKIKKSFEQLSVDREEKIKSYKYKKALSDKIKVYI